MKKYFDFLNEKKDIWQRPATEDESYGPIFYINRKEFHKGVYDGDIVKLDREYIESLDDISWREHNFKGYASRNFTDDEYRDVYVLVNYTYEYGYALRKAYSNIEDKDFLGWLPTGYIRHLTNNEMVEYLNKKDMIEKTDKYNL